MFSVLYINFISILTSRKISYAMILLHCLPLFASISHYLLMQIKNI